MIVFGRKYIYYRIRGIRNRRAFYDLQAFLLNLRHQITKIESRELDAEEQPNVGR